MASLADVRVYEHFIARSAIVLLLCCAPSLLKIFGNDKLIIDNENIVFADKKSKHKTEYQSLDSNQAINDFVKKNDQTLMYEMINLVIFSSIAATPLVPAFFGIKYLYTRETKDIFPAICFFLLPPYANVLLNTAITFSDHYSKMQKEPVIHNNIPDSTGLYNLLVMGMKPEKAMWARG